MAKEIEIEDAVRIAKRAIAKQAEPNLPRQVDDIAAKAFKELHRAMARETINNPEAFLTWKIQRLVLDARRKIDVERNYLQVWANEMEAVKGKRLHDEYDHRAGRVPFFGLSNEIISREEQTMTNLVANAMVDILPDPNDRAILTDRFHAVYDTITELAHAHKKSPSAMANHLKKLIGTNESPGVLVSVDDAMRRLSLKTASEFGRQIGRIDSTSSLSSPIDGAISYFEYAGTRSRVHQQQAAMGIAHLRWLHSHKPSSRGLGNKVLLRLIHAACLYVMEPNDAKHDSWSELGLHDDVAVVKALQKTVAKFSK